MKIVDAAKIMDIARLISLTAMLAYMAVLFIRFMRFYLSGQIWYINISIQTILNCPYARKRVVNRIVHDHKNSVHRTNPDSRGRTIREKKTKVSGYDGNQRGLLKDTHNINTSLKVSILPEIYAPTAYGLNKKNHRSDCSNRPVNNGYCGNFCF